MLSQRDAREIVAEKMISYAQNGEDVVLWRALRDVAAGFYVDIGANDPRFLSITRAFYDAGWSGLCIEPLPDLVTKFRSERPRDVVVQAVISDQENVRLPFYAIEGTGLSTLRVDIAEQHLTSGYTVVRTEVESVGLTSLLTREGLGEREIHFAIIDTEGAEAGVLRSFDFTRTRPWVLVVEATAPTTTAETHGEWEPLVLEAGYRFCLFDGLSRFYVDGQRHPELAPPLSYPAGVFDEYIASQDVEREQRIATLEQRHDELAREVELRDDLIRVQSAQINEFERTISWRVTRPLRALRRILPRSQRP